MPSFRQAFSPFFLKKLFDPRHVLDCTAQLDYGFADTNCAIRSTGRHGRRGGPAAAGGRATRERRNGPAVSNPLHGFLVASVTRRNRKPVRQSPVLAAGYDRVSCRPETRKIVTGRQSLF